MKKFKSILGISGSLLVTASLLSACGSSKEATTAVSGEAETEQEVKEEATVPTLEAEFVQDGNKVTVNWDTNLTVSEENYGGEHVEGEGHAHVYVDGEKVAGLKSTEPYTVQDLEEGTHEIKIALQQNNHEDYNVSEVYEAKVGASGEEAAVPTLEAEFVQDGNKVTINWDTNLAISEEHYGGEHVEGEGHAHVYVDGEKVAGLKAIEPYTVQDLEAGTHKIEIDLQQNDHKPLNVTKAFEVTVE